jgi:hypothetical protein
MAAPSGFKAITASAGAFYKDIRTQILMPSGMLDSGHRTAFWSMLQGI